MNVKYMLENVRGWFERPAVTVRVGAASQDDAVILSYLCEETAFLRGRNGRDYWYYFLRDSNNADIAKYLLARNGVNARSHRSYYYAYDTMGRPALRLRRSYYISNPEVQAFLRSIKNTYEMDDKDAINEKITKIRAQMNQKQK